MRIVLLLTILCLTGTLKGQSDFDERLLVKFNEERITQLQKEHPEIINYWTFYLDNSYYILDGQTSGKTIPTDNLVEIDNLDDFNILELGLAMNRDQSTTYKIAGSSKYLMLLSNREFVNAFNNHNKETAK